MTPTITITVSWAELGFLAVLFMAAGAYVCHQLATYRPRRDDLPDKQGEMFEE